MQKVIFCIFLLILHSSSFSQTAVELISKVQLAQQSLKTVSYRLIRSDTFVTGQTRIITGEARMRSVPKDSLFGFSFWGKRDSIERETIYDGHTIFQIDHAKKTYDLSSSPSIIPHYLGSPGGQMIMGDLVRLDTSKATGFRIGQDDQFYYLTILLPDISEYDVIKRSKLVTIDKKTMLPFGVKSHQETLGKIQDLNYQIKDVRINDASTAYDFSKERVPENYSAEKREVNKQLQSLRDKALPSFTLNSFKSGSVSTDQFKDKVVLLDFWEVWCGPCIASMPKVQSLYEKYKDKGFEVYGMMSEKEQLETARLLIEKRKISFPMLVGNKDVLKDFGVNAVPTYVLVNRKGKVSFISEGFSDELETEIRKNLE